jgi:hypothetical protein
MPPTAPVQSVSPTASRGPTNSTPTTGGAPREPPAPIEEPLPSAAEFLILSKLLGPGRVGVGGLMEGGGAEG